MTNNKRVVRTGIVALSMLSVFVIFAFKAAEWTKGLSSDFIVYGQAQTASTGTGTGTGGTTGGGTTSGGTSTKAIPQIAVGAYDHSTHYGTIIEITNPNSSSITVSGHF